MAAHVRVAANPLVARPPVWSPYTRAPLDFHRRLGGYQPTPLVDAPSLAARLGVGRVLIKCESQRFGLPAFKMLGASWATYCAVTELLGSEPGPWSTVEQLAGLLRPLRPFALAAATDGNHGRAVARMARLLGFDARIFVPEGTTPARVAAIESEGASVTTVAGDYDAAVARSADEAGPTCLVISDTSWPGYDRVPRLVIEGYSTLFWEVTDTIAAAGLPGPDAVVVPVGVGALAAATVNHWARDEHGRPVIVGVEPADADCVMASVVAGRLVTVPGPHQSIMVGLNCGTPSPVAWPLVSTGLAALVAIDDDWARGAMRDLAALGIEAGETGAASLAGAAAARSAGWPDAVAARVRGGTLLLLCTEGAADAERYRSVVGDGLRGALVGVVGGPPGAGNVSAP